MATCSQVARELEANRLIHSDDVVVLHHLLFRAFAKTINTSPFFSAEGSTAGHLDGDDTAAAASVHGTAVAAAAVSHGGGHGGAGHSHAHEHHDAHTAVSHVSTQHDSSH